MRKLLFVLLIVFLLSACGAPAATEAPAAPAATEFFAPSELPALPGLFTITPEIQSFNLPQASPQSFEAPPPTLEMVAPREIEATPTKTLIPTLTPAPTATAFVPTPTETLLPMLILPPEKAFAPSRVPWTGLPTYPGDSDPGLLFRVDYDPDVWAQTEDNYGSIVLAHRRIEYCTVTPWVGRGLPGDWKVEHAFRTIGGVDFDVSTVLFQGNVQFVTYAGGDKRVLTAFQVSFETQRDECVQDAELIFATLRSLAAIPTSTPTVVVESPTPESSPSATP